MYHNFFIHSSIDGHLGYFLVLAIVNSAAVNIGVHVSFVDTVEEGEGRLNLESSTSIYILPCVKQTTSGKLLCSTGFPGWCSVMISRGRMEANGGGHIWS